jgi:hypothetical protein
MIEMAMTKKEKAAFDEAILKAQTLGALRWTSPVAKDLPRPDSWGTATSGWCFNSYSCDVTQAWSEVSAHGYGPTRSKLSGVQNGVDLFSTKLLALRALRHAVECESAGKLRKIDAMIEAEETKGGE